MWLLDNNLPKQLSRVLRQLSIQCATAGSRGWAELTNGELVEVASKAGFTCILTRDKKFQESASRSLKKFPALSIVLIVLPQQASAEYLESFAKGWKAAPIIPAPGQLVIWPS